MISVPSPVRAIIQLHHAIKDIAPIEAEPEPVHSPCAFSVRAHINEHDVPNAWAAT